MKNTSDDERETRRSIPTASFSLYRSHIAWIAKRAAELGKSKSEIVREAIDAQMAEDERPAA